MRELRVALVDDHPVVLAGIRALLLTASDIALVGEAGTGAAALHMFVDTTPDIAIIDISLPDMTGIELARLTAASCPGIKILALSVHEDRAYVQHMLQAGARGYLLKRSAAEELVRAIRAIDAGGLYLDPAIASKAVFDPIADKAPTNSTDNLSPRELDVLRMIARGFGNKEIAARLEISAKTVETYKARAAEKLALRTRADIVRYGVTHGWLEDFGQP